MNPEQLGYIAIAAAVIGLLVRLLKQDVTFLPTVPARYRPVAAVILGAVASVLEVVATGAPWKRAIFDGFVAAVTAMGGHNVLINSMRNGRELGTPKTVDPSDAPTTPVLPKDPPSSPIVIVWIGAALLASRVLLGCGVTPEEHAANAAESGQAFAEYTECKQSAKADGGTWDSFCACVFKVDAKHNIDAGGICR